MKITKVSIIMALCFLFLTGCQQAIQPLANFSEAVNEKVQAEQQKAANRTKATLNCQQLCQDELSANGHDFEKGTCLNEEIVYDWSCDVVHVPRQEVDDDPENQCQNFRQGVTHNLIEIDGNCNVVKVYD